MKLPPQHSRANGGIALIIVLISIFVLTMLAGGFAYSMKVETRLAQNASSEAELEWLGRSGVEYARWILAEQMKIPQEPYDALNQVWAGGQGGIGTSNSPLVDVQREVRLGNGKFTWKIVDLESKANINTADERILGQAFMAMGVDAGESTPLVGAILDWIDPDDNEHTQGAENEYYHSQKPSYDCKNGPIDDLSELLFVKGITPDLYWGTFSTNHPPAAFQEHLNKMGRPVTFAFGLADVFTPISTGRINLNTASAEVLQLIPMMDRQAAEAIVAGRQGEDDGSGLTGPYRSVDQVSRVPELPRAGPLQGLLRQYCDVRSRTFQVTVDAEIGGYKRQFVAVLGRNTPRDIQILTFYWK
jgi:general secretion pathway protein K